MAGTDTRAKGLFINPYNFISLSDKKPQLRGDEKGKYTGYIEYSLTTRSSLFIPNVTSDRAFTYKRNPEDDPSDQHTLYDFFSYETLDKDRTYDTEYFEPVIPGSEVRGMFRSIYETLTNSCLSVIDSNIRIGKRTVEHFTPGVLIRERGKVYLYYANDVLYRNKKNFSEKKNLTSKIADGSKVYYDQKRTGPSYVKPNVIKISNKPGNYAFEGYLLKGNIGPDIRPSSVSKCEQKDGTKCVMLENGMCKGKDQDEEHCYLAEKHCAHVFSVDKKQRPICLTEESLNTLRIVLEQYQKEDEHAYEEYRTAFKKFSKGQTEGLPVYFSRIENVNYIMLSPACITREIYRNAPENLAETHRKCNSEEGLRCPACSLFGTVNTKIARGSKIRFTDLHPAIKAENAEEYYDKKLRTLAPLAVPHLSNTEFYLKKPVDPEVWYWTYDYYTVKRKDGQIVVKPYDAQIAGRKFYWNNLTEIPDYGKKTGLNRTVRTVRKGVEFTGRVYFDQIDEIQLRQIVHILNYTADGKHGYKLGTGKPLGLGSIELKIKSADKIIVRIFGEKGYSCTPQDDIYSARLSSTELEFDGNAVKQFELMTRYLSDLDMSIIRYPCTEKEDEEGFQWFVNNRGNYAYRQSSGKFESVSSPNTRKQTRIHQSLLGIESGEIPRMSKEAPKESKEYGGKKGGYRSAHGNRPGATFKKKR